MCVVTDMQASKTIHYTTSLELAISEATIIRDLTSQLIFVPLLVEDCWLNALYLKEDACEWVAASLPLKRPWCATLILISTNSTIY